MSANNIVIIEKGKDGRFRGYHRDMDMHCDGSYEDGAPCFCLVGKEEGSKPDEDCFLCGGTGRVDSSKFIPEFEVDTMEEAIHAYNEWLRMINDNEDGFLFYVEYGYQFVGLEPNQETVEAMEELEEGGGHKMDSVEELMEDLEKRNITGKDEEKKIYYLKSVTAEELSQVCVGDWIEGIGDILSITEAEFVRKFGKLIVKCRKVR